MVDAILDAAARVFESNGPDGATTNAIAELAGVSIGSLYQYFPNKLAIVHALIDSYQQELRDVWDQVLAPERAQRPVQALVDEAVDAIWKLASRRPAFLVLLHSSGAADTLAAKKSRQLQEAQARITSLAIARDPSTVVQDAQLRAMIVSRTVHALLALAAAAPRARRDAVIAETKRIVTLYLSWSPQPA